MSLRDLHKLYGDRVDFLMIYIREAHPVDGWWLGGGVSGLMLKAGRLQAATDIYDPKTMQDRLAVAQRCEVELEYGIRTAVDDMDDSVSKAYAASPTRLYLIGADGRVTYAGGPGPFGFKPRELGTAIEEYLGGRGSD